MTDLLSPKRLISLLFIVGISVIFILQFGPGSSGCAAPLTPSATNAAAVVNGEEIPLRDFGMQYANQIQYYRSQGHGLPSSLAKQIGLPNRVLEQMIDVELLSQAATQHGIKPSDDELRKAIHDDPSFQVDGKFDFARYQQLLQNYFHKTPQQYEDELRKRLAAGKMLELVASSANVSDDEVKARYFQQGNKAKATFVRFTPAMFVKDVAEPKPAEVAAYVKAHAKAIADYYNANKFQFHKPEQVRARHILIALDKNATDADKKAALEKVQNVRQQIADGKLDFAAAAKQFSDDKGSKDQGGELGFNERESWVKEFSDAAFSLKPGELSQPVLSPFGYHLIQVEEKKPAQDQTLAQAQSQIAATLIKKEKATAIAQKKADEALKAMTSGKALADLYPAPKDDQGGLARFMTASAPQAEDTGEFGEGADVPQLGNAPELSKAIFAANGPTALNQVFKVQDGFVVAQVTERERPSDQAFQAKKDELREQAIQAKQIELRESFVTALRKNAKIVTNEKAVEQIADAT